MNHSELNQKPICLEEQKWVQYNIAVTPNRTFSRCTLSKTDAWAIRQNVDLNISQNNLTKCKTSFNLVDCKIQQDPCDKRHKHTHKQEKKSFTDFFGKGMY